MSFFEQILKSEVYANTDIVKKCKKYPEFHEELYQNEVEYAHDLNMALYSTLEEIEQLGVFQVTKKGLLSLSFYAYLMPTE